MTINTPGRDMVWSNRFCWFSFFSLLFSFSLFSSFLLSSLDAFCGVRVDRVLGGRSFLTPIVFFLKPLLAPGSREILRGGRQREREERRTWVCCQLFVCPCAVCICVCIGMAFCRYINHSTRRKEPRVFFSLSLPLPRQIYCSRV